MAKKELQRAPKTGEGKTSPAGKSEETATEPSRSSPAYVVLALAMAIGLMVIFYAVTSTASSDAEMRPYALSLALGVAAILLLFGLIDVSRASKGLLDAAISVLPSIHSWGIKTTSRAILFACALLGVAAASVWFGPQGVATHVVQCDDAQQIEFSVRSGKLKCDGAFTRKIWLTPFERNEPVNLACFDAKSNRWNGTYVAKAASYCGARPQDASYIKNGITLPDHDLGTVQGKRLSDSHARLRAALSDGSLPDRTAKDRLLFATWNIRELGRSSRGLGFRMDESYAYIAEILSHFDVIAIQELKDRSALTKLLALLGDDYKAEFSFVAPGNSGNRERQGFIYDTRKVAFGDISTTIVFETIKDSGSSTGQPSRPPFLAEFIVNGRKLFAVTTHVYFGRSTGPYFERRLGEIEQMASGLDSTFERNFPAHPVIFAGDMNVSQPDGREMEKLTSNGFETTDYLRSAPTNLQQNRPYDQIMIRSKTAAKMPIGKAGVSNAFEHVFRLEDWEDYRIEMKKGTSANSNSRLSEEGRFKRYYRTYQISDHHLKWAEFRIDW